MLHVPGLLDATELTALTEILGNADWVDGRQTAGHLSHRVKNNHQLAEGSPEAAEAGAIVTSALDRNALFMSAALPARIVPPLFNRYGPGDTYGAHIDGAIRHAAGYRIRTDISATIFLTPPYDYDGGELMIAEEGTSQRVKLDPGAMLLYPATSIHAVDRVTRGLRTAAFFWIQSIIRDRFQRQMLFELDQTIQGLTAESPDSAAILPLTGHYHNLVRLWADG